MSTGAAAAGGGGGGGGLKGSLGSSNSSFSTAAAGVQRGVRVGLQLFAQQVKATRVVNGQPPQQQQGQEGFKGGDGMEVSASGLYGDLPLPKQARL